MTPLHSSIKFNVGSKRVNLVRFEVKKGKPFRASTADKHQLICKVK